jgi:hypothetical protein
MKRSGVKFSTRPASSLLRRISNGTGGLDRFAISRWFKANEVWSIGDGFGGSMIEVSSSILSSILNQKRDGFVVSIILKIFVYVRMLIN